MGRHASRRIPRFPLACAILLLPGCRSAAVAPQTAAQPAPMVAREVAAPLPAPPALLPAAASAAVAPLPTSVSDESAAAQDAMTGMAAHPMMRMRHRGMGMMGGMTAMGGCAAMRGMGGMHGRMADGAGGQTAEASPVSVADCPTPTADLAAQGRKIFTGKGNCATCHGMDAKGTALAPNLVQHKWLNIDGSYAAISALVQKGVAQPKQHPAPMPPMGGASLSSGEICAVAAYVYLLSHKQ